SRIRHTRFKCDWSSDVCSSDLLRLPSTHYQPYIVKEVEGVRVGVLGLTTPGIPNWENLPNYAGLEFHETVSEAKKWVAILRDKRSEERRVGKDGRYSRSRAGTE